MDAFSSFIFKGVARENAMVSRNWSRTAAAAAAAGVQIPLFSLPLDYHEPMLKLPPFISAE